MTPPEMSEIPFPRDDVGAVRGVATILREIREGTPSARPLDQLLSALLVRVDEAEKPTTVARAKLLGALKSVSPVDRSEAALEQLVDYALSYWAGAREAADVRKASIEKVVRERDARPTAEAWRTAVEIIRRANAKLRDALGMDVVPNEKESDAQLAPLTLIDKLIKDRDGWKHSSEHKAERFNALEAAALNVYRSGKWIAAGLSIIKQARMWETLRDALCLAPGTATAAGVGSKGPGDLGIGAKIKTDSPIYTPPATVSEFFKQIAERYSKEILAQREEILTAFVAKYGFEPDEAIQVEGPGGQWRVERRAKPGKWFVLDSDGIPCGGCGAFPSRESAERNRDVKHPSYRVAYFVEQ